MTTSPDAPVHAAGPGQLRRFNELPAGAAYDELLACCAARAWARQVEAGRPYESVQAALRRSDEAVAGLSEAGLAEALAGHPRIGDRAVLADRQDGPRQG